MKLIEVTAYPGDFSESNLMMRFVDGYGDEFGIGVEIKNNINAVEVAAGLEELARRIKIENFVRGKRKETIQ